MKRFVLRLAAFAFAVAAVCVLPTFVLVKSKETAALDPKAVAAKQRRSEREILFGLAYANCTPTYKLAAIADHAPRVLALGSSRSMQLRPGFFEAPDTAYNGGGLLARAADLDGLLPLLPSPSPELVILVWTRTSSTRRGTARAAARGRLDRDRARTSWGPRKGTSPTSTPGC